MTIPWLVEGAEICTLSDEVLLFAGSPAAWIE
ncbi:hypothetical protein QFZ47_000373 [Variovorax paradoxus]|nr:hypothetical protein [Variovorax paradoxus]